VGTDHDTAAFAVETIPPLVALGRNRTYPSASRLLITADGGGYNGYRTRSWKTELDALAAETRLAITMCHLPPALEVEQDRAPAVLPHLDELARSTTDQPRHLTHAGREAGAQRRWLRCERVSLATSSLVEVRTKSASRPPAPE
jgi:hypothetical protein